MYLYVERWIARPAWLALSVSDRIAYLDQMGAAVHELTRTGVRLIGVATSGSDAPHSTGERYVAAWAMPEGASQVRQLESILAAAGWHDYFVPAEAPKTESASRSFFDFTPSIAPMEARVPLARRRN